MGDGSGGSIRYSSSLPINKVENPLMYYYMHYRILMDSKFITNTFLLGCHSLCRCSAKENEVSRLTAGRRDGSYGCARVCMYNTMALRTDITVWGNMCLLHKSLLFCRKLPFRFENLFQAINYIICIDTLGGIIAEMPGNTEAFFLFDLI